MHRVTLDYLEQRQLLFFNDYRFVIDCKFKIEHEDLYLHLRLDRQKDRLKPSVETHKIFRLRNLFELKALKYFFIEQENDFQI